MTLTPLPRQRRAHVSQKDEQIDSRYNAESSASRKSNRVKRTYSRQTKVQAVIVLFLVGGASWWKVMTWIQIIPPAGKTYTITSHPILTAYLETTTFAIDQKPLPPRKVSAQNLKSQSFPQVKECRKLLETFPIDDFPQDDPFLPWIHDVFPSHDGQFIHFVAQNKRRCTTGKGLESKMLFWEPQIALFQPVPIVQEHQSKIRLASSFNEATVNETRFICRFHTAFDTRVYQTFSVFPFNYEYISWRKGKASMFEKEGKDNIQFWLSQLLFKCPVPEQLQNLIRRDQHITTTDFPLLYLDIIPIRTPARQKKPLFTSDHVGADLLNQTNPFDLMKEFGAGHYLPRYNDSGRWANVPICQRAPQPPPRGKNKLVACTWTASNYARRGDVIKVNDTETRMREWILYLRMVGFDKVVVYDNTSPHVHSSLKQLTDEFGDFTAYHRWPCTICNNNRPSHRHPGDRSSQYAAEASCRERYGPTTEWMSFLDTDEYIVPMAFDTWTPILDNFTRRGIHILKMRSSRAKPRIEFMEPLEDQALCIDPVKNVRKPPGKPQNCLVPMRNQTFLQVYNCEFIKPPRPDRFERAMKQIYRPDYVQSHFVHYSTVTKDVSKYRTDFAPDEPYVWRVHRRDFINNAPEIFLNEVSEGMLVHTRSVMPHESMYRKQGCQLGSKYGCPLGIVCPDSAEFKDEIHKDNVFRDDQGNYCNCWRNQKVDQVFVPQLQQLIRNHLSMP